MSSASQKQSRTWFRALTCSRNQFDTDTAMDSTDGSFIVDDDASLIVPGLGVGCWRLGLSLHQALSVLQRRMTPDQRVGIELIGAAECDVWLTVPGYVRLEFNGDTHLLQQVTSYWPWSRGGVFVQLQPRQINNVTASRTELVLPRPFRLCRHGEQLKVQDVLDFNFPVCKEKVDATGTIDSCSRHRLRFQGLSFQTSVSEPSLCSAVSVFSLDSDDRSGSAIAGGSTSTTATCSGSLDRLCGRRGMCPVSVSSIVENTPSPRCTGVKIETLAFRRTATTAGAGETSSGRSRTSDGDTGNNTERLTCRGSGGGGAGAAMTNTHMVMFGESVQSVVGSLGYPDAVYYCSANGDEMHSWRAKPRKKAPAMFTRQASKKLGTPQQEKTTLVSSGNSKAASAGNKKAGKTAAGALNADKLKQAGTAEQQQQGQQQQEGTSSSASDTDLVCYNYFDIGMDIVFTPDTSTVCRIVLHSNSPCHPSFGQYSRCPFRLTASCCCSLTQCQHPAAKHLHSRSYITPSTRWPTLVEKNACGCARLVGNVEYRNFSCNAHTATVQGSTGGSGDDCGSGRKAEYLSHCAVLDQYLFEVMAASCRDGHRLQSITILQHPIDTVCHGNYPGRSIKQVHEEFEAKQAALLKKAARVAAKETTKFEVPASDSSSQQNRESKRHKSAGSSATTSAGTANRNVTSRATKPPSILTVGGGGQKSNDGDASTSVSTSPVTPTATAAIADKTEKKSKQMAVITPRQTETSKLRKDKSQKFRLGSTSATPNASSSSSEQKAASAKKTKKTPSQARLSSSSRSTKSSSHAEKPTSLALPSHTGGTDTTDGVMTTVDNKPSPSEQMLSASPTSTAPTKTSSYDSDKTAVHETSTAPNAGHNTLQEYASAFRPRAALDRSPPRSPQLAESPHSGTGALARTLFPEVSEDASLAITSVSHDRGGPPDHRPFSSRQEQRTADPEQHQAHALQVAALSTTNLHIVDSANPLALSMPTTPRTPTAGTPSGGNTPSSNRRSWTQPSTCGIKDQLSESLKEDDIRLESILHDHDDVANALSCRAQLLRTCQSQWRSGAPHIAIRSILGTAASTVGHSTRTSTLDSTSTCAECLDSAALVNLVQVCNDDMPLLLSVDMSADILPVIAQLLSPQQRLSWTEVLCRYVSMMVEYVQGEIKRDSALTRREATMDRTVVGLRRNLVSLHASLDEALNSSASPLSPLDSLPIAPAWRRTLEEADSSERCKCTELLHQTLQHVSLLL